MNNNHFKLERLHDTFVISWIIINLQMCKIENAPAVKCLKIHMKSQDKLLNKYMYWCPFAVRSCD